MKPRILIACECSQTVALAFRRLGYEAFSCDLQPSYGGYPGIHIIGDARDVVQGRNTFVLEDGRLMHQWEQWDLIIAHPPCQCLTMASTAAKAKGLHTPKMEMNAVGMFYAMLNAPARFVAVENPVPLTRFRLPKYDQVLQPYNYGHPYSKRTCLWLRNLPPLIPMRGTYLSHESWVYSGSHSSKRRSKTFTGIAEAMAAQWGSLL